MKKKKLIRKGKGYKVYLTEDGKEIIEHLTRFNIGNLATKIVDRNRKKFRRAKRKRELNKIFKEEL